MAESSSIPVSQWTTPVLQANLGLLRSFDASLVDRILNEADDESLFVIPHPKFTLLSHDPEGKSYLVGGTSLPGMLQGIAHRISQCPNEKQFVVLMGSDAGYAFHAYIPAFRARKHQSVVVVESSVARLRALLSWIDIRSLLPGGRLYLSVQPDVSMVVEYLCDHVGCRGESVHVSVSPRWPNASSLNGFEDTLAQVQNEREKQRSRIIQELQARSESSPRVVRRTLLLDAWPQAPQTAHIQSVHEALEQKGVETMVLPLQGFRFDFHREAYHRELQPRLLNTLHEFQPDLVLSYAYHATHFVEEDVFHASGAAWVQVISNILFEDRDYYAGEHVIVNESAMKHRIPPDVSLKVAWLPLAANYVADEPVPWGYEYPLVFVGNWMGFSPEQRNEFRNRYQGRDALLAYVDESVNVLGDPDRDINLYEHVSSHPIPDVDAREEWFDVFRVLLSESTGMRRQRVLEAIADKGLVIFGNWKHLDPQSPLQACLRGPIRIQQERELFSRGTAFMNIHSVANADTPNMRFFNTAGMGSLQITNGKFERFLNDKETLHFQTRQEAMDQVDHALSHEKEMADIRQQAWERVCAEWTYTHWIQRLFDAFGFQFPAEEQS